MTTDIDQRVKAAFDELQMPPGLAERTIAHIEGRRPAPARPRLAIVERLGRAAQAMSRSAAAVAVACVLLGGSGVGGYVAYATETASVAVTAGDAAQAGVTLGVNRFGRVVSVWAEESELGEEYGAALAVKGMGYEEALAALLELGVFSSAGELAREVDVRVSCSDESQLASLESQTGECLGRHQHRGQNGGGEGMHMGARNGMGRAAANGF